jgi:hypothetical protein
VLHPRRLRRAVDEISLDGEWRSMSVQSMSFRRELIAQFAFEDLA